MQDPVLEKMQQLMEKYQGQNRQPSASASLIASDALPVLKDIVKLGDAVPASRHLNKAFSSDLAEQLAQAIEMRLQGQLDQLLNEQIRQAINGALAASLPALREHISALVRASVNETLAQQGSHPPRDK